MAMMAGLKRGRSGGSDGPTGTQTVVDGTLAVMGLGHHSRK